MGCQLVENLRGTSDIKDGDVTILKGDFFDEGEAIASGDYLINHWFPRCKLYGCMYFGEFEIGANLALENGGLAFIQDHLPGKGFGLDYIPMGLCCFVMAQQTKHNKYKREAQRIRRFVQDLVQKKGCVNLAHGLCLLNAEYHALYDYHSS